MNPINVEQGRPKMLTSLLLAGTVAIALASAAPAEAASRGHGADSGSFTPVSACMTISTPGSYALVNDITTNSNGNCIVITANFVDLDLAGFTMTSTTPFPNEPTAILSEADIRGIVVHDGSIFNFGAAVVLNGNLSLVENLRISATKPVLAGIQATGIVRNNIVDHIGYLGGAGTPIDAIGIITGNYVTNSASGLIAGAGSVVVNNVLLDNIRWGVRVTCPSSLQGNAAFNSQTSNAFNFITIGAGCAIANNAQEP